MGGKIQGGPCWQHCAQELCSGDGSNQPDPAVVLSFLPMFFSTIAEMAETYQEPQQVIEWYNGNEQILNQIKSMVLEDQVVDQLLASAKVVEKEVSYEEAIKPAEQANAEQAGE